MCGLLIKNLIILHLTTESSCLVYPWLVLHYFKRPYITSSSSTGNPSSYTQQGQTEYQAMGILSPLTLVKHLSASPHVGQHAWSLFFVTKTHRRPLQCLAPLALQTQYPTLSHAL